MISATVLGSFFFSSAISLTAGGVTKVVDINRQPANMSEAKQIIRALKDKLSAREQLLRENRWPLLVRGEIDRLFDRYGEGIKVSKDDIDRMLTNNENSKVQRLTTTILCERMIDLYRFYGDITRLRKRIEKAHQCDEEITIRSFCEAISDVYDCISENDAPYLRLHPGERAPKIMNILTSDKVNKYVNILMDNVKVKPVKKSYPKGMKGANSTVTADQKQGNVTTATTAITSPATEATTATAGEGSADSAATTDVSAGKKNKRTRRPARNSTVPKRGNSTSS